MMPERPTEEDEVPPWRLFVGHGPYLAVSGADARVALAAIGEESVGSILVTLGPGGPRTGRAAPERVPTTHAPGLPRVRRGLQLQVGQQSRPWAV